MCDLQEETVNSLHAASSGGSGGATTVKGNRCATSFDSIEAPSKSGAGKTTTAAAAAADDDDQYPSSSSRVNSRTISYDSNCKASMFSCFVNLANTVLGSGMLGLPYAYSHTGWVLGTFLLLICGCCSAFALHLLSLCALREPGPASFYSVAMSAMPSATVVIDLAVAIKCFGVATSYLIVIGDLMPDVLRQLGAAAAYQDRHLWVFLGFCIVAPLSCLRNLDSLKFTSLVSIVFVAFLTLLVVLYSADISSLNACADVDDDNNNSSGGDCSGDTADGIVNVATFQVLAIFVFGYTCQQNIFAVTNELERPSPQRINSVILLAIGTAFVIYMIVAGCGYKTYGSNVLPDILVNYPRVYLTSVARLFVSLLVAFSYPLQCHPSRRSVLTLIANYDTWRAHKALEQCKQQQQGSGSSSSRGGLAEQLVIGQGEASSPNAAATAAAKNNSSNNNSSSGGVNKSSEPAAQRIRFFIVTACFLGLSLLIALTITDLGTVLAFVGATGSTTVSYILPGFFYYRIFHSEGPVWKRTAALVLGCAGLIIMPLCLAFIFV